MYMCVCSHLQGHADLVHEHLAAEGLGQEVCGALLEALHGGLVRRGLGGHLFIILSLTSSITSSITITSTTY